MALSRFKYVAVDIDGNTVKGKTEAEDQSAAIAKLRQTYPVVKEITDLGTVNNGLLSMNLGSEKIKPKILSLFCSQFSIILKSGAQIATCVELLAEQATNKRMRKILFGVSNDVQAGRSLALSFERNGGESFPPAFYETIRAGEESGNVAEAFDRLAEYFKKASRTRSKIVGALIYPCIVLLIAVVAMFVIMTKVIPPLAETFAEFTAELPALTKMLISASDFFVNYWWVILVSILGIVVLYTVYYSTKSGKYNIDELKLRTKLIGPIRQATFMSDFASNLGMLLRSGLVMTKALETTERTSANVSCKEAIKIVTRDVESGKSLGGSLKKHLCFPKTAVEMISIGEDTGNITDILDTVAEYYDNEADSRTQKLLAALDPILLVFIAFIAIFIVLAVYIPMFEVYDLF